MKHLQHIHVYTALRLVGAGVFLLSSVSLHAAAAPGATACRHDAVSSDTLRNDTVAVFKENILFPKSSAVVSRDFSGNGSRIDSIRSFLTSTDAGRLLDVKVTGSYSPEGDFSFNTGLGHARADALADMVADLLPDIAPATAVRHPFGQKAPYPLLRSAELCILYRNEEVAADTLTITPPSGLAFRTTSGGDAGAVAGERREAPSCPVEPCASGTGYNPWSRIFLYTNMLYDVALTPNLGVGMGVTDRLTVTADWMWARWSNRDRRRYWRIYGGDLELRYRIGPARDGRPLAGHHIGVYGSLACYDFQAGRSHTGVLSDRYNYAVGVSYTYSLPLSARFNIDFSLGVGYLWGTYKKHTPIDDCDVWLSTHRMRWFGPTRVGVSLVWLVGNAVANSRKGGDR